MAIILNPTLGDLEVYVSLGCDHMARIGHLGLGSGTEESLELAARVLREPLAWDQPLDYVGVHAAYLQAMLALERVAVLSEAGDKEAALAHVADFAALLHRATTALARQRLGQRLN